MVALVCRRSQGWAPANLPSPDRKRFEMQSRALDECGKALSAISPPQSLGISSSVGPLRPSVLTKSSVEKAVAYLSAHPDGWTDEPADFFGTDA